MCNPALLLLAGTALSTASSVQQGISANKIGKVNQALYHRMAMDAKDRGAAEEQDARLKGAAFKGEQAARLAAQGGEINTGSSANILADTAQLTELDALRIRNNADREAYSLEASGAIERAAGQNARTGAFIGAAGTALTGGAEVASRWKVYKKDNPGSSFTSFLTNG